MEKLENKHIMIVVKPQIKKDVKENTSYLTGEVMVRVYTKNNIELTKHFDMKLNLESDYIEETKNYINKKGSNADTNIYTIL